MAEKKKQIKISNKMLIIILSLIIVINITVAFTYHIFEDAWLLNATQGDGEPIHHFAHRIIMTYHSVSTPFIGIVLILFLEFIEIRSKVVLPIKIMAFVGGLSCGIGAIFWAYTDIYIGSLWISFHIFHNLFVGGLGVLFICALVLCYGLIPGKEVKANSYYDDIPKIRNFDLIHINALTVIIGMIAFTIFGALAALMMLLEIPPVHFFLIELIEVDGSSPIYVILANFHGRLTTTFFLIGLLILIFRYTKIKGKAAKLGLWMVLIGSIGIMIGYFLMVVMGPWVEVILMPSRALILSTGVIIAVQAWKNIMSEQLGSEFERASITQKIKALVDNPLKFGMYLPFILAILVVLIPSLMIVADPASYNSASYIVVMRNFATGHPHTLVTLGAITVFSLLVHDLLPENTWRKIMGWILVLSQIISFPIALVYFVREPTSTALATALKHMIIAGLFLLLLDIIIYVILVIRQAINNREWLKIKVKLLVKEK